MLTKYIPYGVRAIAVAFAFVLFPSIPILLNTLGWLPGVNGWIIAIWIVVSLYLWSKFSRYMLVTAPYNCSSCGKPEVFIAPEEEGRQAIMYYKCLAYGHRRCSGVVWHGDSGG